MLITKLNILRTVIEEIGFVVIAGLTVQAGKLLELMKIKGSVGIIDVVRHQGRQTGIRTVAVIGEIIRHL